MAGSSLNISFLFLVWSDVNVCARSKASFAHFNPIPNSIVFRRVEQKSLRLGLNCDSSSGDSRNYTAIVHAIVARKKKRRNTHTHVSGRTCGLPASCTQRCVCACRNYTWVESSDCGICSNFLACDTSSCALTPMRLRFGQRMQTRRHALPPW